MVKSGKHGKVGHLRRTESDDASPSYCGRKLAVGPGFTDRASGPVMCKRCSASIEKRYGKDHHHLRFSVEKGCWVVILPPTRYMSVGAGITWSGSAACGIDGCTQMVPFIPIIGANTSTSAGNTMTWLWAA